MTHVYVLQESQIFQLFLSWEQVMFMFLYIKETG